jgi:hypothetical protein
MLNVKKLDKSLICLEIFREVFRLSIFDKYSNSEICWYKLKGARIEALLKEEKLLVDRIRKKCKFAPNARFMTSNQEKDNKSNDIKLINNNNNNNNINDNSHNNCIKSNIITILNDKYNRNLSTRHNCFNFDLVEKDFLCVIDQNNINQSFLSNINGSQFLRNHTPLTTAILLGCENLVSVLLELGIIDN